MKRAARREKIGRYLVMSELGAGAMGVVYEATDPLLERTVALKTIEFDPDSKEQEEFRRRFQAEAKSAGRLSHPNVVTVYDVGEDTNVAYIAMEFLKGETLRSILDRQQKLPVRRAVRYAFQIADGLAAAHAGNVVHRDIKPGNIVRLDNGVLKIADFGIAQLPTSHLTQDGTVLGTPKYMSPEQVRGLRVDGRSDIFSLGVVLYEMLTGTLPFGGGSVTSIMYQIVHEAAIHPAQWVPDMPASLTAILAKCLAKDQDARYQHAEDLVRDLRQVFDEQFSLQTPEGVFLPLQAATATASDVDSAAEADATVIRSPMKAPAVQPKLSAWSKVSSRLDGLSGRQRLVAGVGASAVAALIGISAIGLVASQPAPNANAAARPVTAVTARAPVANPPQVATAGVAGGASLIERTSLTEPGDIRAARALPTASQNPDGVTGATTPASITTATAVPAKDDHSADAKGTKRRKKDLGDGSVASADTPHAASDADGAEPVKGSRSGKKEKPLSGFDLFLKKQKDCIVDHRCAPRPDPNEIRN